MKWPWDAVTKRHVFETGWGFAYPYGVFPAWVVMCSLQQQLLTPVGISTRVRNALAAVGRVLACSCGTAVRCF